jgi:hypothetical protein
MRFSVYKQNIVGNALMISGLISMALGILILNVFISIEDTGAAIAFLGIILSFLGLFVNADTEESFSRINKNYLKNKRFRDIVNPEDNSDYNSMSAFNRKDVLEVTQKNTKVKCHLVDLEYTIINYIKVSDRAYRSDRIEELDAEVRDLYKEAAQLILSDGVKSVLSGRADAFKKDIVELVVSLIIQQTIEVKKIVGTTLSVINSDGEIAEKDAVSVLRDPKYKHLIK